MTPDDTAHRDTGLGVLATEKGKLADEERSVPGVSALCWWQPYHNPARPTASHATRTSLKTTLIGMLRRAMRPSLSRRAACARLQLIGGLRRRRGHRVSCDQGQNSRRHGGEQAVICWSLCAAVAKVRCSSSTCR